MYGYFHGQPITVIPATKYLFSLTFPPLKNIERITVHTKTMKTGEVVKQFKEVEQP